MSMEKLTEEQRNFVARNHNLIYYCFLSMKLPKRKWDDYYSYAAEGLCKASKVFDEKRGRFSTIALHIMKKEIYREYTKERAKKRNADDTASMDSLKDKGREDYFEDKLIRNYDFHHFFDKFSEREKNVIKMIYGGYIYDEIAKELGVSKSTIDKDISNMRRKCNEYRMGF